MSTSNLGHPPIIFGCAQCARFWKRLDDMIAHQRYVHNQWGSTS